MLDNHKVKLNKFGRVRKVVSPGEHLVTIEADGCLGLSKNYTFKGAIVNTVKVSLKELSEPTKIADGHFLLCLYAERGLDLLTPLRAGASDTELTALLADAWTAREDRGAEDRARLADRGALYQLQALRADPRKEMHTRGG